mgnify:CR=1 FL=1
MQCLWNITIFANTLLVDMNRSTSNVPFSLSTSYFIGSERKEICIITGKTSVIFSQRLTSFNTMVVLICYTLTLPFS